MTEADHIRQKRLTGVPPKNWHILAVYKIFTHGSNYRLQFEREHAMLVLASDLDPRSNIGLNFGYG